MRAAIWDRAGAPLRIGEVADPTPAAGELVLRVRGCGICGSDLHLSETRIPGGFVMGHEFAGEVVGLGPGDCGSWRVGDRVCALPAVGCGRCHACLGGDVMVCPALRTTGLGQAPGAYAEYVLAGSRESLRLPDALDFHEGALIEPLAVGLHAVHAARLEPGDDVLVVGAGPVGLACALWARHLGAREVVVSDPAPGRRAAAAAFGATAVLDPSREEVAPALERLTGSRPRAILECVGAPGLIAECLSFAPARGRIVVVGICMEPDSLPPFRANLKELTLRFVSFYRKQDFRYALDMLGSGRVRARALVTDRVGLEGLPEAFEALKRPTTQCKVMVEP